jgi:hypothetical protein
LNDGDAVRAPLLLLHLQIDPNPSLSKFNPWHRGPGPGGGQFTSGPDAGGDFDPSAIEPAGQSMGVDYTSTYRPGEDPTADIAHEIMTRMVQRGNTGGRQSRIQAWHAGLRSSASSCSLAGNRGAP